MSAKGVSPGNACKFREALSLERSGLQALAPLSLAIKRSIAPQCPQGSLDLGTHYFAFLKNRHAVRGENLSVFEQVIELIRNLVHLWKWDTIANLVLKKLVELLPFWQPQRPGRPMNEFLYLGQGMMNT